MLWKNQMFLFLYMLLMTFNSFSQESSRYQFTVEELESGFAFNQFKYLIDNNQYCVSNKVITSAYGQNIMPGRYAAIIDYSDGNVTVFLLYGHRTTVVFLFTNIGQVDIGGVIARERPVNENVLLAEIRSWESENNVNFNWNSYFEGTSRIGIFQNRVDVISFIDLMNTNTVKEGFDVYRLEDSVNNPLPEQLRQVERIAGQFIKNNSNNNMYELWATMFRLDESTAFMYFVWFTPSERNGYITLGYSWRVNKVNPMRYY